MDTFPYLTLLIKFNFFGYKADLLIQQASFYLLVREVQTGFDEIWLKHKQIVEQQVAEARPIFWSILSWRRSYMARVKREFMQVRFPNSAILLLLV